MIFFYFIPHPSALIPALAGGTDFKSSKNSMNDVVISLFAAAGFDKAAQGLAGAGRRLADELGGQLRAVILGAEADRLASEVARVADTVTVADQVELAEYQPETYLRALVSLCREIAP